MEVDKSGRHRWLQVPPNVAPPNKTIMRQILDTPAPVVGLCYNLAALEAGSAAITQKLASEVDSQ